MRFFKHAFLIATCLGFAVTVAPALAQNSGSTNKTADRSANNKGLFSDEDLDEVFGPKDSRIGRIDSMMNTIGQNWMVDDARVMTYALEGMAGFHVMKGVGKVTAEKLTLASLLSALEERQKLFEKYKVSRETATMKNFPIQERRDLYNASEKVEKLTEQLKGLSNKGRAVKSLAELKQIAGDNIFGSMDQAALAQVSKELETAAKAGKPFRIFGEAVGGSLLLLNAGVSIALFFDNRHCGLFPLLQYPLLKAVDGAVWTKPTTERNRRVSEQLNQTESPSPPPSPTPVDQSHASPAPNEQ